jgi:hypothetical protein
MPNHRTGRIWSWLVAVAVALGMVGASLAQNPAGKAKGAPRGKARAAGARKGPPNALDPLAKEAEALGKNVPAGTFHYTLKLHSFDSNIPLAATYYPSKQGTTAPVLLMVHQKERSSKDFEEPISELKGQGLAEHLQGLGYAVLLLDLRGHGANMRRVLSSKDWRMMNYDLQAAYHFLVDRNNRGDVNLSKFGVLGVGEGANLIAAWAAHPAAAVSLDERPSDINALILISPLADGEGFLLSQVLAKTVTRFPTLVMAGERDAISADPVKTVKERIERVRINRVELFPSSLHGYKLLRLEPKATSVLTKFLEGTIKFKATEWEPRYNLSPVVFTDIRIVRNAKPLDAAKAKAKARDQEKAKEDEAKAKDDAKEKNDDKAKDDDKDDAKAKDDDKGNAKAKDADSDKE